MGLFGKSKEEQAQEVEFEIRTQNTWFAQGLPKAIVRNLPNGGNDRTFEVFKAKGCNYIYPCIQVKDCVRIVETDQTLECLSVRLLRFNILMKNSKPLYSMEYNLIL